MAASARHANSWQQGACQVATAAYCYHHSPTPSTQTQKKYHLSTVGLSGTFQVLQSVPLSSPVLYTQPKHELPQDGIQSGEALSQGGPPQLARPSPPRPGPHLAPCRGSLLADFSQDIYVTKIAKLVLFIPADSEKGTE